MFGTWQESITERIYFEVYPTRMSQYYVLPRQVGATTYLAQLALRLTEIDQKRVLLVFHKQSHIDWVKRFIDVKLIEKTVVNSYNLYNALHGTTFDYILLDNPIYYDEYKIRKEEFKTELTVHTDRVIGISTI